MFDNLLPSLYSLAMTVVNDNKLEEGIQTGPLLRTVTRLFAELQQRRLRVLRRAVGDPVRHPDRPRA